MKRLLIVILPVLVVVALALGQRTAVPPSQDLESEFRRLVAIQARYKATILSTPGVRAFGIGKEGNRLVFHVYVAKEAQTPIRLQELIEDVPVRRFPIGPIEAQGAEMGTSTSNGNGCYSGTLGLRVFDAANPAIAGYVTNNHVAAAGGSSLCPNAASAGTKQYSPSTGDSKKCKTATEIGQLNRFVPLIFSSTVYNRVDAAFVAGSDIALGDTTACGLCSPSTTIIPPLKALGQAVVKCGRTTKLTVGTVNSISIQTGPVGFGTGGCQKAIFDEQIVVTGSPQFSAHGDSGSAVYAADGSGIVGLLFAGEDGGTTLVNPIADVFAALNVTPGLGAPACTQSTSGTDSSYGGPGNTRLPRVYPGTFGSPAEVLVAIEGGTLLKFRAPGGTGQNLFAIQNSGGTWSSLPCYSHLLGSQQFPSEIRDVDFIGGFTFVSLADGRIVKINGSGGTGQNMFAINIAPGGFTGISGYSYYVGSHKFPSGIANVTDYGQMLISFDDGRMLKIAGTGGSGLNLFAIKDNGTSYSGLPGYQYYIGDQSLGSGVTAVAGGGSGIAVFVATANGKVLKVNGLGGTGHNMFAVTPTSGGYNPVSGYNYYAGDQKFYAPVTQVFGTQSETILALADGRMLKVNGTGGTGHNMFAVYESLTSFAGVPGYNYYVGDQKLSTHATAMAFINGNLLIGFADGKMLKVNGTGGTGHNMFAVQETANGFTTLSGYNYLVGSTNLGSPITEIVNAGSYAWIGVGNGKLLKVNGNGGNGFNMFAVVQNQTDFSGLCGYSYLAGSQGFK